MGEWRRQSPAQSSIPWGRREKLEAPSTNGTIPLLLNYILNTFQEKKTDKFYFTDLANRVTTTEHTRGLTPRAEAQQGLAGATVPPSARRVHRGAPLAMGPAVTPAGVPGAIKLGTEDSPVDTMFLHKHNPKGELLVYVITNSIMLFSV